MNQALCRDGVQVTVGTKITEVATRGALKIVRYTDPAGQPDVEGLGLEEAGVMYDRRLGVQVDARLRMTNPRIFAAGDVCSRYQFTHAADALARHAGEMIGLYTILMTLKLGLGALTRVIQPYPTQAEAVRKTGDAYNRTRLTPLVKKLMVRWFAWQRGRLAK